MCLQFSLPPRHQHLEHNAAIAQFFPSTCVSSKVKERISSIREIVSAADYLLWVTRGYILKAFAAGAEFAPSQGLLGVLRNEYALTTSSYTSPGLVVHVRIYQP
ncbi:hypothetical protein MBR_05291, partial [Metarhizium brunneum ARSEF 3297]